MALAKNPNDISFADAAKCVQRPMPVFVKDGKPTGETKLTNINVDDILYAARLDDGRVGVVTKDGQKFYGDAK